MALRNVVGSPAVALAMASIACTALAVAVTARACSSDETPAPVASPPAPPADAGVDAHHDVGSALPVSEPPAVRGVEVTPALADQGIALTLALSLHVGTAASPRDLLAIHARCMVAGEWYDGSTSLLLDRLAAGDRVISQQLVVGSRYHLAALPSACHLQFEHWTTPLLPAAERVLAVRCWNGHTVLDGRCDAVARAAVLELHDVRVTTGAASSLRIALEAELHRAVSGWSLRVAADCTLPGGKTLSDTATIPLGLVTAGVRFSDRALLFWKPNLPDLPTACTIRFELEDIYRLAHEPVAVRCWAHQALQPGSCRT